MINDDKPMLKCTDDRILVCGTPWDGKDHLSRNTAVPLRALVSLAHGETNVITPASKGEGLASLYQHAYRPKKEDAVARVLQLETSIVSRTDCFRLACNMDPEAAIVAYAGITGNTFERE